MVAKDRNSILLSSNQSGLFYTASLSKEVLEYTDRGRLVEVELSVKLATRKSESVLG